MSKKKCVREKKGRKKKKGKSDRISADIKKSTVNLPCMMHGNNEIYECQRHFLNKNRSN
jgi:hypothetical protein